MTDKEISDEVREALNSVAYLMTEAKKQKISIGFSIQQNKKGIFEVAGLTITKEL